MADGMIKLSGELESQTAEQIVTDSRFVRGVGANVDSKIVTFGSQGNYKTELQEELAEAGMVEGSDYADNGTSNTQFKATGKELSFHIYKGGSFILEGYPNYSHYIIFINGEWTSEINNTYNSGTLQNEQEIKIKSIDSNNYYIKLTLNNIKSENLVTQIKNIKDNIPTKTSDLNNDLGFITGINSTDVTNALGYTPGTSNFSGNYNDLSNKLSSGSNISINGSNQITLTSDVTISGKMTANNFLATSDKRLKEHLEVFNYGPSILDLPIYTFDYIDGPKNQIGCLAQDLQELYPNLVDHNKNCYLTISETKLVYLLMEEVKRLVKRVEELENKAR